MAAITGLSGNVFNPGQTLTINGTSFGANQGGSQVFIGPVPCTVTQWGDTQIQVTIPANAPTGSLYVDIKTGVDGGTITVTNAPLDTSC